jgi:hypothetical protein
MPTLAELQAKLDSVRREVRNLTVMGMDPSQPPDQAALIKELERALKCDCVRWRSHTLGLIAFPKMKRRKTLQLTPPFRRDGDICRQHL